MALGHFGDRILQTSKYDIILYDFGRENNSFGKVASLVLKRNILHILLLKKNIPVFFHTIS